MSCAARPWVSAMSLVAGLAVGAGLAGTTYPAWLASRKDPVEALAYE